MKIIIVGDGKMGFALSQRLSDEGHDIVIIDNNPAVLRLSSNTQDVGCICGNGVDSDVQKEAGVPSADLLIAVTSQDEINIICCLIAKKLGAKHTIARVRSPEYSKTLLFMREELGLSLTVNPELAAAAEISRVLRFPSAMRVDFFAKGKVEMVEFKVPEGSPLTGLALRDLPGTFRVRVLVCAVQRDGQAFIPSGDFVLRVNDQVSITGAPSDISRFFKNCGLLTQKSRSVMIVGGGKTSYYLSAMLSEMGMQVKILEVNANRCAELSEALPKVMVINGDGSDREVLQEEGIDETDALVALTGLDEENVVVSMYAISRKVGKVITKINHISFGEILEKAGIDCVITPHRIAANRILRYVRGMQASIGSRIESLYRIINDQAEALEFRAHREFRGIDIPLKDLKLKKNLLVACILRDNKLIFPGGEDCICDHDNVIIITTQTGLDDLDDILQPGVLAAGAAEKKVERAQ